MGSLTREAARERLAHLLGDSTNPDRAVWSVDEMNDALSHAYFDLQHESGILEYRFSLYMDAGEGEYEMPERAGRILRVTYDDYVLEERSRAELECEDQDYTTRAGDPWFFYRDALDDRFIGLYPVPQSTGDSIEFDSDLGNTLGIGSLVFDGEYGEICEMFIGDDRVQFDSEFGILIDIELGDQALEVWCKKEPDLIERDDQAFEFPDFMAQGFVFVAAAYLLTTSREFGNKDLAAVYSQMAEEAMKFVKRMIGGRQPRSVEVVGRTLPKLRDKLSADTRIAIPAWN